MILGFGNDARTTFWVRNTLSVVLTALAVLRKAIVLALALALLLGNSADRAYSN